MKVRNLFRPLYILGRAKNWIYELRHPDHPWLAPDAIKWLQQHLHADMQAFEWGSGRSTLWVAARVKHLVSVENDPAWFAKVNDLLTKAGRTNTDLRLIPLEHPEADTYENEYAKLPANAAAILGIPDGTLDLVIVDGWYRPVCAKAALSKLKPGGYLLIDNTNWQHPPHVHVPDDWPLLHRSHNVMTETSIWSKPDTKI